MEEILQITVFQIGARFFGMEIDQVRGIVENVGMLEASNIYPDNIIGILPVGDDVIPVIDLCAYLDIEPPASYEGISFLLFQKQKSRVAFPVNRVEKYCNISRDCLNPVSPVAVSTAVRSFRWIANMEGRLVPILDTQWLMERVGN
ncbi:MAG: chemotaxis protein CheW [Roseburia sp.]|nr:chemotaxis protein CheW [Roseburia sp.]